MKRSKQRKARKGRKKGKMRSRRIARRRRDSRKIHFYWEGNTFRLNNIPHRGSNNRNKNNNTRIITLYFYAFSRRNNTGIWAYAVPNIIPTQLSRKESISIIIHYHDNYQIEEFIIHYWSLASKQSSNPTKKSYRWSSSVDWGKCRVNYLFGAVVFTL